MLKTIHLPPHCFLADLACILFIFYRLAGFFSLKICCSHKVKRVLKITFCTSIPDLEIHLQNLTHCFLWSSMSLGDFHGFNLEQTSWPRYAVEVEESNFWALMGPICGCKTQNSIQIEPLQLLPPFLRSGCFSSLKLNHYAQKFSITEVA